MKWRSVNQAGIAVNCAITLVLTELAGRGIDCPSGRHRRLEFQSLRRAKTGQPEPNSADRVAPLAAEQRGADDRRLPVHGQTTAVKMTGRHIAAQRTASYLPFGLASGR